MHPVSTIVFHGTVPFLPIVKWANRDDRGQYDEKSVFVINSADAVFYKRL